MVQRVYRWLRKAIQLICEGNPMEWNGRLTGGMHVFPRIISMKQRDLDAL
jgi:hypothetical protein